MFAQLAIMSASLITMIDTSTATTLASADRHSSQMALAQLSGSAEPLALDAWESLAQTEASASMIDGDDNLLKMNALATAT